MIFPPDQIVELKSLCPGASRGEEAGVTYFLLPQLALPQGCTPSRVDALLCPTPRDGYEFRLFFGERITSKNSRNWHVSNARILERNWHAFSYKINANDLRLAQMVIMLLRAL
jgi:hypothetical protein